MIIALSADGAPQHPEDQNGVWRALSGRPVVLAHGDPSGHLEAWAESYLEAEPDCYVVSCHPRAVQAAHPHSLVLGDWEGVTDAYIDSELPAVYVVRNGRYVTLFEGVCILTFGKRPQ